MPAIRDIRHILRHVHYAFITLFKTLMPRGDIDMPRRATARCAECWRRKSALALRYVRDDIMSMITPCCARSLFASIICRRHYAIHAYYRSTPPDDDDKMPTRYARSLRVDAWRRHDYCYADVTADDATSVCLMLIIADCRCHYDAATISRWFTRHDTTSHARRVAQKTACEAQRKSADVRGDMRQRACAIECDAVRVQPKMVMSRCSEEEVERGVCKRAARESDYATMRAIVIELLPHDYVAT